MRLDDNIKVANAAILLRVAMFVVVVLVTASCGKLDETVNTARDRIVAALETQSIYERGNLPVEDPPTPEQIKGYFDIVGGAYRYLLNKEDSPNRGSAAEYGIERGDSISFYFDARIFTGGNFENQQTFFTNIEDRIKSIAGGNPNFSGWPTKPLRIKVGEDPCILKSLQEALISCRAGDGDPDNDEDIGGVASDRVRVFLTPDIAFGDKMVYNVPPRSTIVFEVTDIVIIE